MTAFPTDENVEKWKIHWHLFAFVRLSTVSSKLALVSFTRVLMQVWSTGSLNHLKRSVCCINMMQRVELHRILWYILPIRSAGFPKCRVPSSGQKSGLQKEYCEENSWCR
ncbi:hypothetical protein N656DRAFT_775687 [Canariomyces notabilis]|uniref:Uncharacterized protein n=1 Tax=Canariomyces notabilis TaxID=2074819 RepID=A0AAN6TJS5_9PEZI|nr:hypothetical protein N656DRAFT_775687 [Canariomyces arenarius]